MTCGIAKSIQSGMPMSKLKDETGKVFGSWTVLRRAPPTGNSNHAQWWCRCACGREASVTSTHLRRGKSVSCGCSKHERSLAQIKAVNEKRAKGLLPYSKKRAA